MPKICPTCERIYPDFVDFCVAGGFRLQRHVPDQTVPGAGHAPGEESETTKDLEPLDASASARLFPKVDGELDSYGVEFSSDVVLGRYSDDTEPVDVDLSEVPESATISPRHAKLRHTDGTWFVEDLGSERGVRVNSGGPISEAVPLRHGDELWLGKACFVFETVSGEGS